MNNPNPLRQVKRWGKLEEIQKGKQFQLHMRHSSCYSCYKPEDKSWMRRKWSDCHYVKRTYFWSFVTHIFRNG